MGHHESCYVLPCLSRHYERVSEQEGAARLSNLQEYDGIWPPRSLESLNNRTRATGNIGAAVSSDLCLITDASERYAFEGATKRSS